MSAQARLAVDIGGTFTDLVVEVGARQWSAKVLTTPTAPERGVLSGIDTLLTRAGLKPSDIQLLIHGTTLATNALIERKGARTALIVTEGFRDSVEMAFENRFEQYDIMMERPPPLVPRHLRLGVTERLDARGNVIKPLDENSLRAAVETAIGHSVESLAVGFLHSYANPVHEQRARDVIQEMAPGLTTTLSSEVCPEMREYERWSTACANAYVQPVMASYLKRLESQMRADGMACPIFLITSAGGLTTIDTASRYPIRLVESGPAGGAILAARIAKECGYDRILSFDMGGTTAKICLIDNGQPHYSRSFEVARQYRFLKGSGLPLRIPVIEMVEIGAGGGSIAGVDALRRIQVGPASAGSEPGPACYGRGGEDGTVTDADVVIGRIDPDSFAGGTMRLDAAKAATAVARSVGARIEMTSTNAALGIAEIVEENMANAARVHAVERGRALDGRTMIAFGGAAPLHAARLAEKLGIDRIVIPTGAGVGSACGFLVAPISYEVVRSRYALLTRDFDTAGINGVRAAMRVEALKVVEQAAPDAHLTEQWTADMRYRGQGHEVTVAIPARDLVPADFELLSALFAEQYQQQFGRSIPDLPVEAMSWALRLSTQERPLRPCPAITAEAITKPVAQRHMADPDSGEMVSVPLFLRSKLRPGVQVAGPAILAEDETTTIVARGFRAQINGLGYIIIEREHVRT